MLFDGILNRYIVIVGWYAWNGDNLYLCPAVICCAERKVPRGL